MDRRHIFLGLPVAIAAASSALAQGSAMPAGPGASPTAGAKLGNAEVEHAKKTAIAGAATLESSKVAVTKAQNEMVKMFAMFERDEQMTIAEVLEAMDPSLGAAKPDAKMADMLQKMNAMPAGAEFDKAYVAAQVQGHETLLSIQEEYLKVGRNREHVAVAKMARGVIKEHLALLAHTRKMLG